MPIFANPAGLWALTAIPVVLAIHFLQRKARAIPVSTLFLLEKTQRDALHGRRIDRLTPSIPLLMQLLAVLLATWLLMEPRYPSSNQAQRIALVVDSSASMQVSKEALLTQLATELRSLQSLAKDTEFIAWESNPSAARLYQGKSIDELLQRLQKWQPYSGEIDPTNALRLARSLVSAQGTVIYLTDVPPASLSSGAIALSMGKKIDNVGFTGISFENREGQWLWRATLQNYSDQPTTRTWQLRQSNRQQSAPKSIELPARGLVTLQAALPAEAERAVLILSPDDFVLDDSLHFVRPATKQLSLAYSPSFQPLAEKFMRSIDGLVTHTTGIPDVSIASYDPLDPLPIEGNALVFVNDDTQGGKYLAGGILAEKHPWLDGLNWQSLLIRESIGMDVGEQDQVLLSQGKRPLIAVRTLPATPPAGTHQQLLFHFDPRRSNIENQPAWIVLLLRFIDDIRNKKVAFFRENTELMQTFPLARAPLPHPQEMSLCQLGLDGKISTRTALAAESPLLVPRQPGFYQFVQGDQTLCEIAANFADTREADFRRCAEINQCSQATLQAVQIHSVSDPFRPLWILLLLTCLLVAWFFSEKNQPPRPQLATSTPLPAN
jgi:hypothetical protein